MAHEPFDIIGVPLVEASIEVRFPGDARIEALRGDFQQAVRQECPHLLVPKYREGEAPALAPHVYRSDGGKRTIALAIHMLAYSTQDYPGWQAFLGRYLRYWSLLEAWIAPKESTRVGLRYVNRLDGETRRHLRHSDPPPFLVPLREPVARHHGTSTISAEGHELDVTVHYDGEEELTIDFDAHVEGVHGARLETTPSRGCTWPWRACLRTPSTRPTQRALGSHLRRGTDARDST